MILAPIVALELGWEAFFPVMLTSAAGAMICLMFKSVSTCLVTAQLKTELVQDLVSAQPDHRELVLTEFEAETRNQFIAEIERKRIAPLKRGSPISGRTRLDVSFVS